MNDLINQSKKDLPVLRPYQEDAISLLYSSIAAGNRRIMLTLPTGAGKTVVASQKIFNALKKGQKVLFITHKKELVRQTMNKVIRYGDFAGVIMGNTVEDRNMPVQVATIQTISKRILPNADIVFIDECHHTPAKSYKKVLNEYPDAVFIGLTATPFRNDSKPLGFYEDIITPTTIKSLTADGFLAPTRYFGIKYEDIENIRIRKGDYDDNELFKFYDQRNLYGDVVEHYKKHRNGKAIVFSVNKKHSEKTCLAFTKERIKAAHLDCDTPGSERDKIIESFRNGEYQVLCNVALFTEGFDVPDVGTVILNRATKSKGLYYQMIGRGLRPESGKEYCVIIDHGNNVAEHGFIEHHYDLNIQTISSKNALSKKNHATEYEYRESGEIVHLDVPLKELTPFQDQIDREQIVSKELMQLLIDREQIVSALDTLSPRMRLHTTWRIRTDELLDILNSNQPKNHRLTPQYVDRELKAMGIRLEIIDGFSVIIANRADFYLILAMYSGNSAIGYFYMKQILIGLQALFNERPRAHHIKAHIHSLLKDINLRISNPITIETLWDKLIQMKMIEKSYIDWNDPNRININKKLLHKIISIYPL